MRPRLIGLCVPTSSNTARKSLPMASNVENISLSLSLCSDLRGGRPRDPRNQLHRHKQRQTVEERHPPYQSVARTGEHAPQTLQSRTSTPVALGKMR